MTVSEIIADIKARECVGDPRRFFSICDAGGFMFDDRQHVNPAQYRDVIAFFDLERGA